MATRADPGEKKAVLHVVTLLSAVGVALGYPHSSAIGGSEYPLRELRPKAGASPLRVIYAFDPRRDALLILGGDKGHDKQFYTRAVKRAEQIWKEYLKDLEDEQSS